MPPFPAKRRGPGWKDAPKRSREDESNEDKPQLPPATRAPTSVGVKGRAQQDDEIQVFEGSLAISDIEKSVGVKLHPSIVTQLEKNGFKSLFPIQVKTLAACVEGKDVMARARTGSGKTLAFALPVVQTLTTNPRKNRKNPHVIVLSPTRELALQSHKVFESIIPESSGLKSLAIYGGISVHLQKSEVLAAKNLDIIVGTPGRMVDFLKTQVIKLDDTKVVILDEADRMLDEGFSESVESIIGGVPVPHQLLLFSATIPEWVDSVVKRFGKDKSRRFDIDLVGENTVSVSETVTFYELLCYTREERLIVLGDLVRVYAGRNGRAIIFVATKAECHDLGVSSALRMDTQTLHGDMQQVEREKTMQAFRDGKFNVLIATDVAARGLDIPRIDLVVQTSVPTDSDSFIHRAGRTGRAGRRGVCIVIRNRYDNMYRLASKCGIQFQPLSAPSKGEVMQAISGDISSSIETVDDSVVTWFQPEARKMLQGKSQEESETIVAKALALLAGYSKKEKQRSLIGNRMGAATLLYKVTDDKSRYWKYLGMYDVLNHIEAVFGPGTGRNCRHVTVINPPAGGAYCVFDMDDTDAEKLVEAFIGEPDMKVAIIDALPEGYVARAGQNTRPMMR